jgi:hypothetical protein
MSKTACDYDYGNINLVAFMAALRPMSGEDCRKRSSQACLVGWPDVKGPGWVRRIKGIAAGLEFLTYRSRKGAQFIGVA